MFSIARDCKLMLAKLQGNVIENQICSTNLKTINDMKKLSKITLAKTYDVLSENEMKKVVGGMGSGSGTPSATPFCEDPRLRPYICTFNSTGRERGMVCANSEGAAEAAFCGTDEGCKKDLSCV